MVEFKPAQHSDDYVTAKELFLEYAAELPVDLSFQNFTTEVERISDEYGPPSGVLILVIDHHEPIGCFAIRKFENSIGELKRMYLRKAWQGQGIGMLMLRESMKQAQQLGYKKLRLDTLPSMQAAISLYRRAGFYEIPPYRFNPVTGTRYFEASLLDN